MDAVFELIAHGVRELGKSITQFHQGRLTTAPRLVQKYSLMSAENGRHNRYRQTERYEHEFQALPPLSLLSHGSCG